MCQARRTVREVQAPALVSTLAAASARGHQLIRSVVLIGLFGALGACGNKGDLFLEGEDGEVIRESERSLLSDESLDPTDGDVLDLLDADDSEERERRRREGIDGLIQQ